MMKFKMLAIMILVFAVMLSGCGAGNSENASNASNASNTANKETEVKPLEQVDVSWFTSIGFWPAPPQWDTTPGTIMGNITENTGVKFTFDVPPQDGDTKLNLLLVSSGDNFPDLITTVDQGMATKLASSGKVWELDEFLKKYSPESHLLKEFPADIKNQIVDTYGGWYYFPSHMKSADLEKQFPPSSPIFSDSKLGKNQGVMVNKNLLEQAGLTLDDLKTESGFLNALQKVKDMKLTVDGQPVVPLQIDGKDYQKGGALMTLQQMFGATEINKDGNYRNILLAPGTKNAIQFLNKAYRGGYLDAGQLTMDNDATKARYASGSVFAFVGNMANIKYDPQYVSPGAILSDDGSKPVFTHNTLPGIGWMKTFISKSTKHPEQLARFIDHISSPEGYINSFFGIKDVHYTVDDQGLITLTDKHKEVSEGDIAARGGLGVFWQFSNLTFEEHAKKAVTTEEGLAHAATFQAFGKTPGIERFNVAPLGLPSEFYAPGSENVKIRDQIGQAAEIQISKMVMAKDQAAFDKYYDEYVDQLKKLNVDKLDAALSEELHKKEQKLGIKANIINP